MKRWMTCLMLVAVAGCQKVNTGESQDHAAFNSPNNYVWQELAEIKGACLKPKDWHFSKVLRDNYTVYRLTREQVSPDNEFLTGLSIHVCENVPEVKNMRPSQYAASQLSEFGTDKQVLEQFAPKQVGAMVQSGGTYKKVLTLMGQTQPFTIHVTTLANDNTGTLYIMVYGCPENQWAKFLDTIATIGSDIALDPTI